MRCIPPLRSRKVRSPVFLTLHISRNQSVRHVTPLLVTGADPLNSLCLALGIYLSNSAKNQGTIPQLLPSPWLPLVCHDWRAWVKFQWKARLTAGTWSPPPPQCTEPECPVRPTVIHEKYALVGRRRWCDVPQGALHTYPHRSAIPRSF